MPLYSHMQRIGFDHFRIELIEQVSCNNIHELLSREGHWIRELHASLNKKVAGRTKSQYRKEHREQAKQKTKEWYERNREHAIQWGKEKFNCDCGGKYTRASKSTHAKTMGHQLYLMFGGLNQISI